MILLQYAPDGIQQLQLRRPDHRVADRLESGVAWVEDIGPRNIIVGRILSDHLLIIIHPYLVGDIVIGKGLVIEKEVFRHIIFDLSRPFEIEKGAEEVEIEEVLEHIRLKGYTVLTGDPGIFEEQVTGGIIGLVERSGIHHDQDIPEPGMLRREEAELAGDAVD